MSACPFTLAEINNRLNALDISHHVAEVGPMARRTADGQALYPVKIEGHTSNAFSSSHPDLAERGWNAFISLPTETRVTITRWTDRSP
jgi:hypothetical protein